MIDAPTFYENIRFGLLVLCTVAATDTFSHRDELSARRFRELNPATVASDTDKSRNRRWHRLGFFQRLGVAMLLAAYFSAGLGAEKFGAAFLTSGALFSLGFDIFFNIRFGLRWDYAGTTAWFDEWLERAGKAGKFNAGKAAALVEALGVLAGAAWWWLRP